MEQQRPIDQRSIAVQLEVEIRAYGDSPQPDTALQGLRKAISRALLECFAVEVKAHSLADSIQIAATTKNSKSQRIAALLLTRLLGVQGALPTEPEIQRYIVDVFVQGAPDLAKQLHLDGKRQTFERFAAIADVHERACMDLSKLTSCPSDPDRLVAGQPDLLRGLGRPVLNAYLQPYDFGHVKEHVTVLIGKLREVLSARDQSFSKRLLELSELVQREKKYIEDTDTFLVSDYYKPFVSTIERAVDIVRVGSRERFVCEIAALREGADIAEKHYPLNEVNRAVKVAIRLINKGPGVALDVRCDISNASQHLICDDHIVLGDIPPGPFALAFEVLVIAPVRKEGFVIALNWLEVGSPERKDVMLEFALEGQNPDVNWGDLETKQPYSTEVAEGAEFVGRRSKVSTIAARYLKERMVSSFITGQKRVGKTSLARAVEGFINLSKKGSNFEHLYLEWGQYSCVDPVETVEALGKEISDFLGASLPRKVTIELPELRGSLAPLGKLADTLLKSNPKKRFLIILDEFDEIHLAMYRFGALAETFFSNLRALSAKRNLAFLLVGGEKMPFVMSAQGDQLNKVVREQLDYFSRDDEWDDYKELVRRPVEGDLNWSDAAILRLYELTNGHPFYTKLLCNAVYGVAVMTRDSEITPEEIDKAAYRLTKELDSNVFAHIWKDGIQQEGAEAEVIELRRRRLLTAIARVLRDRRPLTLEGVVRLKSGLKLTDAEVQPLVNDLVRRGFLLREEGEYKFAIKLFQLWLVEHGAAQLISDALAEEYELSVEKAEEEAYVSAGTIVDLVDRWHTYRGQSLSTEMVRAWLEQVPSRQEQRILFKLLSGLRFVSTADIREKLKSAHGMVTQYLRPFVSQRKIDRRQDVFITYVDGVGKSGNRYASLYADENRIAQRCVIAPELVAERLPLHERESNESVSAIVLIDDFVGTGKSLSADIASFVESNRTCMTDRRVHLLVVALCATKEGEERVRKELRSLPVTDIEFRVCEVLDDKYYAFSDGNKMWKSKDEALRAKDLCMRVGASIYRENPLGFGNQGLLLVFPDNCPNNSLPMLHADSSAGSGWRALFPRSKT